MKEDITIVLFSDHGPHLGGIKANIGFSQRPIENFNPVLFMYNVKGMNEEQEINMKTNQ